MVNPNPTRNAFREYLIAENKTGSNKAASYLRAIDLLDSILSRKAADLVDTPSIWTLGMTTPGSSLRKGKDTGDSDSSEARQKALAGLS